MVATEIYFRCVLTAVSDPSLTQGYSPNRQSQTQKTLRRKLSHPNVRSAESGVSGW